MKHYTTLIHRTAGLRQDVLPGVAPVQITVPNTDHQHHLGLARIGLTLLLLLLSRQLHAASIIEFSATAYLAREDAGQVQITVLRAKDLDTVVSVDLVTTNLSATAGADYLDVSTNLTFFAGQTIHMVTVPILNDGLMEKLETFQAILNNPTGGAFLGSYSSAVVYIKDNDPGLQIEGASFQVREDDGSVLIGVLRGNDGDFPVAVEYATADGAARAGADYTPVKGQLDFAAGEQMKLIQVPVLNDGLMEPKETFRLYLTNVAGAVWGTNKSTTITVVDNDLGVHFAPTTYWISEKQGNATLTVVRGNDIELGAFTVDYATRNGVALAGQDYTETQGTIQFAEGERAKALTVPIIPDETAEPDEQFTVILSNPTGKAVLGAYTTATVKILESVEPWVADPRVAKMMAQVQPHDLHTILAQVTGDECVLAGGNAYVINNRNTSSDQRTPIWKATQLAFESLQSLGLDAQYQGWKSGFTNVNVVGTQTGESRTNEYVLVTAHLDDMPTGWLAPGADDNASGVAAVLTAARIFSQYRFERTIQFVLFTGEEQGLLGSAAFAARSQEEKRDLVAVINLDMVAWEPDLPPRCAFLVRHTVSSSPDFAIAYPLLKVVETYGLQDRLWLVSGGGGGSDHVSFWNHGFPALCLLEYSAASNPYYHTVDDTIRQVNLRYLTAVVQATVGTLAHLAQPTGERPLGILEVATSDWAPGSGIGGSIFYAKHEAGASENEDDAFDLAWANAPANTNAQWLRLSTEPYGIALQTDVRPTDSETIFRTQLSVVDATGTGVSCSNRLRFSFLTPPDPDRIYLTRIHVDRRYVTETTDYDCVTNLQEVVAAGGFVSLPSLSQVPDGAVYGTCDLAPRFLDTDPANCTLRLASVSDGSVVLVARAQLGTRIVDDVEVSTELGSSAAWTLLKSYTNYVSPDAAHFEAGWTEIERDFDRSLLPDSGTHFFRLKRTWIKP